jgi:Spy/CpxP family protein refolding chaperone
MLATAALLLAFVAGGLSGAAWERHQAAQRAANAPPRDEETFGERMKRRYGVNDAQATRLEAIVAKRRPRMDSVMATVQPEVRAAFDSTSAELREVLTPEQRVKFDREQARRRRSGRFPFAPQPGTQPAPAPAPAQP